MSDQPAIRAEGLQKRFGETHALRGLDLEAQAGTVLGVLGPNGAGKTTAVRVLATLLKPDGGRAEVNGIDVTADPDAVRRSIGLTGQYAAVDENLTGLENLEMFGRLCHLPPKYVRRRSLELLERFDLVDAAKRPAKTYSGGMRRRLDLAAGLISSPAVLFLDEPTTGLDPRSRLAMWDIIGELVRSGTTLLLTTQYLEEADQLADKIVVIDRGTAIATGTADELKAHVGGSRLEVTVRDPQRLGLAQQILRKYGAEEPRVEAERRQVSVLVGSQGHHVADVVRDLDGDGVEFDDFGLRRPTLDDVFLTLTGHTAESDDEGSDEKIQKNEKKNGKKNEKKKEDAS